MVFRSLEMIEQRIAEKLTVDYIARGVHFSKYHYQRIFREIVGDSVMEYVIKRKLTLAGKALLDSRDTILEIALRFGYESHEGFTRSFKAYMGVSPTGYRKYSLTAITQTMVKEKHMTNDTKTTDGIVRELNHFITEARETAELAQKNQLPPYVPFWNVVTQDTVALADRIQEALDRVTHTAKYPDAITARFAIMKMMRTSLLKAMLWRCMSS